MRRRFVLFFLFLAGCIFISSNAFAAWTQAKGHAYNQLSLSYFVTDSKMTTIRLDDNFNVIGVDESPEKIDQAKFQATKVTYYGEYGLRDNTTIVLNVGWDYLRSEDVLLWTEESDTVRGIGDITVGLRQKISDNLGAGVLSSFQADLKIPEAYKYENPMTHQNLGDGQYDLTLNLLFGKGFSKGYTVATFGYRIRFENDQLDPLNFTPADQFRFSLGGGYNALSWLSLRGIVNWNKTIGNAKVSQEMVNQSFCCGVQRNYGESIIILDGLSLEQSTLSVGVAAAVNVTPKVQTVFSYNADLEGFGVFKTENAGLGQTYSVAFVYLF